MRWYVYEITILKIFEFQAPHRWFSPRFCWDNLKAWYHTYILAKSLPKPPLLQPIITGHCNRFIVNNKYSVTRTHGATEQYEQLIWNKTKVLFVSKLPTSLNFSTQMTMLLSAVAGMRWFFCQFDVTQDPLNSTILVYFLHIQSLKAPKDDLRLVPMREDSSSSLSCHCNGYFSTCLKANYQSDIN